MYRLRVPGLLITVAVALAACGGPGATAAPSAGLDQSTAPSAAPSTAPSAAPSAATGACETVDASDGTPVRITGFAFAPATVTVKVGEPVVWTNDDGAGHTATLEDGSCRTGTLQTGQSAGIRFDAPGEYGYICSIHPRMTGMIVVEP